MIRFYSVFFFLFGLTQNDRQSFRCLFFFARRFDRFRRSSMRMTFPSDRAEQLRSNSGADATAGAGAAVLLRRHRS